MERIYKLEDEKEYYKMLPSGHVLCPGQPNVKLVCKLELSERRKLQLRKGLHT